MQLYRAGEHTIAELEELFPVTRSTIYRAITRAGGRSPQVLKQRRGGFNG